MCNNIWITWEDHRRSRELAKAFQAEYIPLISKKNRPLRYFILSIKTLMVIIKKKPKVVFCQNPSIVLNFLLCLLKYLFDYKLIADRHSNFKLNTINSHNIKWMGFHFLSRFCSKYSDITIVTNDYLKVVVENYGGNALILPDKLPSLTAKAETSSPQKKIVFISTFSDDEPINEVISAAIDQPYFISITGNYRHYKNIEELQEKLPNNVLLTGFLPESDYQQLLSNADVIIIITDQEYTLTCGAYEAVSLEKVMVLGNTKTIRNYFYKGAIYTDISVQSIQHALEEALLHHDKLKLEVHELKQELVANWQLTFQVVDVAIKKLLLQSI